MALRVWLPLNGNLNNQGLSDLTFSNTNTTNLTINNAGKIGSCYQRATKQTAGYITSDQKYNFNGDITICTWAYCIDGIGSANGLITLHNHSNNTNVGINMKYISASDFRISCNTGNGSGRTYDTYYGTTNIKNAWHHLALTYDNTAHQLLLYVDGIIEYTLNNYTNASQEDWIRLFEWSTNYDNTNYRPAVKLNDVRIYDECLSQKQIKEISKGLVAHYKMETSNINTNLAVYNPLINSGSSSISFDRTTNTYTMVAPVGDSTWGYGAVIGATNKCVVPYNSYYRFSFEVYVPTEHVLVIDYNNYSNDSSVASWNGNDNDLSSARITNTKTIPANTWTKCVFGSQNAHASNTSHVAIYENSKIGIRTANDAEPITWYLRNFKFELDNKATDYVPYGYDPMEFLTTDVSGNSYNLIQVDSCSFDTDSPRYFSSTKMQGTSNNRFYKPDFHLSETSTFSCWIKPTNITGSGTQWLIYVGEGSGQWADIQHGLYISGTQINAGGNGVSTSKSITWDENSWYFLTTTKENGIIKLYLNGELQNTSSTGSDIFKTVLTLCNRSGNATGTTSGSYPFKGSISDVRIYCTALTADDILTLYKTSGIIDNKGNVYVYEFKEE